MESEADLGDFETARYLGESEGPVMMELFTIKQGGMGGFLPCGKFLYKQIKIYGAFEYTFKADSIFLKVH